MADNLLDKASILLTPTAYNDGSMLSVKPENGDGDFTFSRSSAATRVNAQGLVENVQIISSELVSNGNFSQIGTEEVSNGNFSQEGSELVTNGDFATDSDWILANGAVINNGSVNIIGVASSFRQDVLTSGKSYRLDYQVVSTNGASFRFQDGVTSYTDINQTVGYHTYYFKATGTRVQFQALGNIDARIDNVSVKEVGQDWSLESGWSIGDGSLVANSVTTGLAFQSNIVEANKSYKATYSVVVTSGSVGLYFDGGTGYQGVVTTTQTITVFFKATTTSPLYFRSNTSNFTGSITNISVKEVGQDWNFSSGASLTSLGAKITHTPTAGSVSQPSVLTIGKSYKLTYEITESVSGGLKFNSAVDASMVTTVGVHTKYLEADATTASFSRTSSSNNDVTITNISVKEITDDTDLPRINYEGFSYQDSLGSEEVVNGDFSNGSANWENYTTGSSTIVFTDVATLNVDASNSNVGIYQENVFASGKQYKVVLRIKASSSFDAEVLETQGAATVSTIGSVSLTTSYQDFTFYFTGTGTNDIFIHRKFSSPSANQSITIDNVSVKEYLGQEVVPDSGCGSWLLEGQSTNLITYSEDFSQSYWTKQSGVTATYNTTETLSPDGTYNATKFVGNGTTGVFKASISVSGVVSRSVYLKSVSGTTTAVFKGPNTSLPTPITLTITNEWQRFELIGDNGSALQGLWIDDITSDGLYMWGAQLEQQSYATSYIPTNGSIATRLQDIATNSGNSTLINSTEGVLYAEIAALVNGGVDRHISLSDNTVSNHVRLILHATDNRIVFRVNSGGAEQVNISDYTFEQTDNLKIACVYKQNNFSLWINGIERATDFSGNIPIGLSKLDFSLFNGTQPFYGKAKALAVYKEALTDAELQSLTTI